MRPFIAAVGAAVLLMAIFGVEEANAQGFLFGGPLVLEGDTYTSAGISGERRFGRSVGAAFGISLLGGGGYGGAIFSMNGVYNFQLTNSKIEPFATGGVAGIVIGQGGEGGGTGGPNVGGGLTYWLWGNRGLRGEYRLHFFESARGDTHEVRFGFVWKRR